MALVCAMDSELRPLARALALRPAPTQAARWPSTRPRPPTQTPWRGALGDIQLLGAVVGVGPAMAADRTSRLLEAATIDHVVVAGLCGAVGARLGIGALVVPERVVDGDSGASFVPHRLPGTTPRGTLWSSSAIGPGAELEAELAARHLSAVDMETAAVARVCQARGVGWSVLRAVSDRLGEGLIDDVVAGLVRPDGTTDIWAAVRLLATRPARISRLARVARDTKRATAELSGAVVAACRAL